MSTSGQPEQLWTKIVEDFREACILRKNGRHEESNELLQHILPAEIAEWSRLPVAAGRFDPFPRCTDDAIVSGALQAMAGAVTRTLDAMVAAGEAAPRLLLTGGCAPLLLAPLAAHRPCHVPSLVLEGLLVLADAAADECHAQATVASTPR